MIYSDSRQFLSIKFLLPEIKLLFGNVKLFFKPSKCHDCSMVSIFREKYGFIFHVNRLLAFKNVKESCKFCCFLTPDVLNFEIGILD